MRRTKPVPWRQSSQTPPVPALPNLAGQYREFGFAVDQATVTPAFTAPAAARAWMGTEQYKQLKALLLSLKYG